MKRKIGKLAAIALSVYVSAYVILSLCGAYIPDMYNTWGIQGWIWAPRYFIGESGKRVLLCSFFRPLHWLDHRFWHNDWTGRSGPRKEPNVPAS